MTSFIKLHKFDRIRYTKHSGQGKEIIVNRDFIACLEVGTSDVLNTEEDVKLNVDQRERETFTWITLAMSGRDEAYTERVIETPEEILAARSL